MLAAYSDIQASSYMIRPELLFPGVYDPVVWVCADRSKDLVKDYGLVGYKGLMAAVVYQAKIEAQRGDQEAINWLASDDCREYCQAIDFNHKCILIWLIDQELKQRGAGSSAKRQRAFHLTSVPAPIAKRKEKIK